VQLSAVVTKDDLTLLIEQLTPLALELGGGRSVTFGRPERVELVPTKGLRLRGSARLSWDFAGLEFPVTLRAWQLLLEPIVSVLRDGSYSLRFEPVIEELDLRNVPSFLDGRIASAINEGLASQKKKLAWSLSRALGVRVAFPARVSPRGRFELVPNGAQLVISDRAIEMTVSFQSRVVHTLETREAPLSARAPAFAR
jgi:hypothetical protein